MASLPSCRLSCWWCGQLGGRALSIESVVSMPISVMRRLPLRLAHLALQGWSCRSRGARALARPQDPSCRTGLAPCARERRWAAGLSAASRGGSCHAAHTADGPRPSAERLGGGSLDALPCGVPAYYSVQCFCIVVCIAHFKCHLKRDALRVSLRAWRGGIASGPAPASRCASVAGGRVCLPWAVRAWLAFGRSPRAGLGA